MGTQQSWPLSGIFDYAADLLEEHGHIREEFWLGSRVAWAGEPMCIEGALRVADMMIHGRAPSTGVRFSELYREAVIVAQTLVPEGHHSVIHYNDIACDKAEAISFLRDCATKTRPDEVMA